MPVSYKGTTVGPLSSIFLAGVDLNDEGLCGVAVDLSNEVAEVSQYGWPRTSLGGVRQAACRIWNTKARDRLPRGWNGLG